MSRQHPQYLESKVLTASPPRLHLMLIEGAIRFGRQAEESLRKNDQTGAAPALLRMIDIAGELLAAVREGRTELNNKLSELYFFVFRRLAEAKINADLVALGDALQVLEFERETWQIVCEKFGSSHEQPAMAGSSPKAHAASASLSLEA